MTWSVVFRTSDGTKFVAFGDIKYSLPVYRIDEDGVHGRYAVTMLWPSCDRFLDTYYDQRLSDAWSQEEILERYGGWCIPLGYYEPEGRQEYLHRQREEFARREGRPYVLWQVFEKDPELIRQYVKDPNLLNEVLRVPQELSVIEVAFEVGYDVVWWDGNRTHVVGDDVRGIAAYMNSDEVWFDERPRAVLEHVCVLPSQTLGKVTDEFEFRSALRIWADRAGDWMTPLKPDDRLWPNTLGSGP